MGQIAKIFLYVVVSLITAVGYGQQPEKFPEGREDFFNAYSAMLLDTKSKYYEEQSEDLLERFSEKWMSDRFGPQVKEAIITTANMMLEAKQRTYPVFFLYLKSLNELAWSQQSDNSVIAWLNSFHPMIDRRSRTELSDYFEFTNQLFTDHYLFDKNYMQWKFRNADFEFRYDSVPEIHFEQLDLICATRNDSSTIVATRGCFNYNQKEFYGRGGTVDWWRVGLKSEEVYAKILSGYRIDLRELSYEVDTVGMHHAAFFDEPVLGRLSERVTTSPPNRFTTYPQFRSFIQNYYIRNIFEDVNFEGGIALEGSKFIGTGQKDKPAELSFFRGDELFVRARSAEYHIEDNNLSAMRSAVSIYHEQDSLYHPSLKMRFHSANREMSLYRSGQGLSRSPFYDSYHMVDIYCEALFWKMHEDTMSFEMKPRISDISEASFESVNHFSKDEYYKLQGIDPVNPLDLVKKYTKRYNSNTIKLSAFAKYIDKPQEQASAILFNLAARGFLVYNVIEEQAVVKKKLFDYLDAKAGKIDYDHINFESTTKQQSNALLDIENFKLKINGVDQIMLSDSQRVMINPKDYQIIMGKNRDFTFSGLVRAGAFEFYVQDGIFKYDSFKLKLPDVWALSFFVATDSTDKYGNPYYNRVKNVITDLSGELYIDQQKNKSGMHDFERFPEFQTVNDAYVYYDHSQMKETTYDRNRFYYLVEPFLLQGLDDISTEDIYFEGYLESGLTMPPIHEPLVVMDDYSLGFKHDTPDTGFQVYQGKGRFYNNITLSNKGLDGEGMLRYLTTESGSRAFNFYLDSLLARVEEFKAGVQDHDPEFPETKGKVVDMIWNTDTNKMHVTSIDNPFVMYGNDSKFKGELTISPDGMTGDGVFNFSKAEISSELFDFDHYSLVADTSDFRLLTLDEKQMAISTNDYRSEIDFGTRMGHFETTGKLSIVKFPFNQYMSSMDEMEWDMDRQQITLINNLADRMPGFEDLTLYELIDIDFTGSEFISIHPEQDSLAFFCEKATYDMVNYKIAAEGVKIMRVADAAIFPGNGRINISRNAKMDSLQQSYIIADTANKYHYFYNATVSIESKHNYKARGSYDYVDMNDTRQEIKMTKIGVEEGITYATGVIPQNSVFWLSPNFNYFGYARLEADREHLAYDGVFRLNQSCYDSEKDWIRFDTILDPLNIEIPIDSQTYNLEKERVRVALAFSPEDNRIYPAFFKQLENPADNLLIIANGILKYDNKRNKYLVGQKERIEEKDLAGNLLELHTERCFLRGTGWLDLIVDMDPVKITTVGMSEHYIIPDSTEFRTSLVLDFEFDEKSLGMMADSLQKSNLMGVSLDDEKFKRLYQFYLDEKEEDEIENQIGLYGRIRKFPDELLHALVLSDVKLRWYPEQSAYISYGKIGISNILDEQVYKYVDGYVEIEKRRSGDAISIYLELSDKSWYYFDYVSSSGVMQAYSSDQNFNNRLLELDEKNRTFEIEIDDMKFNYEYIISTRRKQIDFVRKMQRFEQTKRRGE